MLHPENNYGKNNLSLPTSAGVFLPADKPKALGVKPTATMVYILVFFRYVAHGLEATGCHKLQVLSSPKSSFGIKHQIKARGTAVVLISLQEKVWQICNILFQRLRQRNHRCLTRMGPGTRAF